MKKTNKKGFTLVELVIVIAVIAILAAVLIPTFSSLIRRANVSKDQQLIRNLNTALIADKALNGNHKTMTDALATAKAAGYDVAQINKNATDNEILWDSKNDAFCYYNDETNAIEYLPEQKLTVPQSELKDVDYFQIVDVKADEADNEGVADMTATTYSIYLRDVADAVTTVKHNKGIDLGKNTVSVNYTYTDTEKQNVIICTNSASTALTIDDSSEGTIYHYGEAGALNIIKCHTSSYHENGRVAFAEIAKGRIVLENGSAINRIHLTATNNNFTNITVAKDETVKMPEFSRDSVEITSGGKLVVALQNGTAQDANKEYIWLTAVGIYEQVTVSDSNTSAGNTYAAETGSDEQKTAAQQIANNITTTIGTAEYTLKATTSDGGTTWDYTLEGETEEANEAITGYTVEVDTAAENPVTVKDGDDNTVATTTTVENGLTEKEKEETKTELVNEAVAPEIAARYEEETTAVVYNMTTKVFYEDLYTAISEVPANTKQTLVLLKNITGTSNQNYVIPANKNIVLDLNGKTLSTMAPDESVAYTILNYGTLVIKDNTDTNKNGGGTGKLTSSAVRPDMQDIPGYASNTITNLGHLTVESGIIENRGAGYACFAIDNQTNGNSYTPVLTINGGKMIQESQYHYAVRMFCNSDTKVNKVIVNGGIISGGYGLWLQIPNSKADKAELIINGGAIQAKDGYSLFVGGSGATNDTRNYTETTIIINGGNIDSMGLSGVSDSARTLKMFEINGGNIGGLAYGANINPVIASNVVIPE